MENKYVIVTTSIVQKELVYLFPDIVEQLQKDYGYVTFKAIS